jgi:hypothetical protein
MMKRELRELREDVENDRFDKRRIRGEDSFPVFKAGTRFLLAYHETGKSTGLPRTSQLVTRDIDNNVILVTGGNLVKLFYASSREVVPGSVEDLVAMHVVSQEDILEELLLQGKITIGEVAGACVTIREGQQKKLKPTDPTPDNVIVADTNTTSSLEVK